MPDINGYPLEAMTSSPNMLIGDEPIPDHQCQAGTFRISGTARQSSDFSSTPHDSSAQVLDGPTGREEAVKQTQCPKCGWSATICPFCGASGESLTLKKQQWGVSTERWQYYVNCLACGTRGPVIVSKDDPAICVSQAWELWDARGE